MNCLSCGKALERPAWLDDGESVDYQFDNALWIAFHGGYAMFTDSRIYHCGEETPVLNRTGCDHEAVICHECAHDLCEKVPWIGKLIDPYKSHAHSASKDWTGHSGWDLDRKCHYCGDKGWYGNPEDPQTCPYCPKEGV